MTKAAMLIIGDEILSGRTEDKNLNFLAKGLAQIGIDLKEVRVVGDDEKEIISAVNALRKKYDFVFTSGGIGPTHDDITSAAIAKAFGDKLVKNPEGEKILIQHYGAENVNPARLKMAFIPSKASLLDNPVSSAPGFRIENVFVMAGIPLIFQAMFNAAKKELPKEKVIKSKEIVVSLTESLIAKQFSDLQEEYPEVAMGSYPSDSGTSLVFRSRNYEALELSVSKMKEILKSIQK
jgi:molybdenum cofactor synthesis domain-containing protein